MPGMSEDLLRFAGELAMQTVREGWRCPCCGAVMSPTVPSCLHCRPNMCAVPRHVLAAVMNDLKRAKDSQLPGQRIVRGTFVINYIEQLIDAVIRERSQ